MRRMRALLCTVGLLAVSGVTLAEEMVTLYGVGTSSCGTFLAAERTSKSGMRQRDTGNMYYPERSMYEQWVSGYVTGYNAHNLEKAGVKMVNTDVEGLMAWLKGYCEKNPTQQVWVAANALVQAESRSR